ncbi:hypothetical protein AB434_2668 [Heyndrickxia coagulans]|uniref:Uncharacterized protein n=1 Tax=Heyndrickxia coagulans TaxID=1398 RepID=A0AAN0WCE8_HEYCO|nr:hypothetical protein SB48_HM08orf04198 [Heyndrickxia coagulans]AKN55073.1 hypothetical protein AB434_2668 [Heyndrickxia coagulans]
MIVCARIQNGLFWPKMPAKLNFFRKKMGPAFLKNYFEKKKWR